MNITEQEYKEGADDNGIPRSLYKEWAELMQAMWSAAIGCSKKGTLCKIRQGENQVFYNGYSISAYFINNEYVSIKIHAESDKDHNNLLMEVRNRKNTMGLLEVIFLFCCEKP